MNWNYRIVRHVDKDEKWYAIHEVYYNEKGKIFAISSEPIAPAGDNIKEINKDFSLMKRAFQKPVIKFNRRFAKAD